MNTFTKILAAIGILSLGLTSSLFASSADEKEILTRVFTLGPEQVEYTQQFSEAVSLTMMKQIVGQITGQVGSFVSVEGDENPYTMIFEDGKVTSYISVDSQSRVAGIQFTQIISTKETLDEVIEKLIAIEKTSSLLVRKNGKAMFSHNSETLMAAGSSFKLAVLAAVEDAVKDGSLHWNQSVNLKDEWKSLPSGILQSWPSGTSLTIETLAALMISMSDNTATDALISIVGKNDIERYLPCSGPLLTTGELFRLKNPANIDLLNSFTRGTDMERRAVLRLLKSRKLPSPDLFAHDPVSIDVEWFVSASTLADLIERVEHLDIMTVNPGVAEKEQWERIAYKGGSEPGVLNLTTFLRDSDGNCYTVSYTANNENSPLNENEIIILYQNLLNKLE